MSNYALDSENRIISASVAELFARYRCIECRGVMQKKFGMQRRAHFYHLRTTPHCRLYSKRADHLTIQMQLKTMIPSLLLERPFPSILRIADLCWEEKKIILEIQCSPIAAIEAEARMTDYAKEGYTLIWLLDDRLYNKRVLRVGEPKLRRQACYFFSLQKGMVYDQFEVFFQNRRLVKGPPLPVNLSLPLSLPNSLPQELPHQLTQRSFAVLFQGDLFERALFYPHYLQHLIKHEESLLALHRQEQSCLHWIKKGFYIGLEWLLQRS